MKKKNIILIAVIAAAVLIALALIIFLPKGVWFSGSHGVPCRRDRGSAHGPRHGVRRK